MMLEPQITFHQLPYSAAVVRAIQKNIRKLERVCNQIVSCRVLIEQTMRRHRQGNLFHIRVDLGVKDGELVISREWAGRHAHEDIFVAIRDAFQALRIKLESYLGKSRIRVHFSPQSRGARGKILRIIQEDSSGETAYGFLESEDGREIYFHKNSVLHGHFRELVPGVKVKFNEEVGDQGPQASSVEILGRH